MPSLWRARVRELKIQVHALLLVPLAVRLIPREVLADCRALAREADARPPARPAGAVTCRGRPRPVYSSRVML